VGEEVGFFRRRFLIRGFGLLDRLIFILGHGRGTRQRHGAYPKQQQQAKNDTRG
jgi:hypothetical protein